MTKHYNLQDDRADLRKKIVGLGERSFRKSYYPELQERLADLERFKTLLDQSNDAIFLIEVPSGYLVDVSISACRQIGIKEEECQSLTIFDILPDNMNDLTKIFSGKNDSLVFDSMLLKGDGTRIPYEVDMRRVKFGTESYVVAIARDITRRKRTESALRESEERFRQLADCSPMPMGLYDVNNNIIYVNKKAVGTFGYTLEDIPHMNDWWRLAYPDLAYRHEINEKWTYRVNRAIEESKEIEPMEALVTCKDGSVRQVEFLGIILGKLKLIILQDITERKQAEDALKDAKAQAELYLDLMSHDMINMNQAMMGYLELIKVLMRPEMADNELIDKPIEIINRSSRMIDSVKKLTQLQTGNIPLKEVDVCKMLTAVISSYSNVVGRQVTINYTPAKDCRVLAGDMLKDVFDNLVDNAIRHSTGPLTIDIVVDNVKQNGQVCCRISIADTGPGIPDNLKKRIFLPLKEIGAKAERRGFGTYLVRTLINHYRGEVGVEDRIPGDYTRGVRFVVTLPVGEYRVESSH